MLTDKKFSNSLQFASQFDAQQQQSHDAGYDAYMTGVVFATLAKYIEIGLIITNKEPKPTGKKKQKAVHYSQLQNKPVEFACLEMHESRVMLNVDSKSYFQFKQGLETGEREQQHKKRVASNCLQLQSLNLESIHEVAAVFREYGDVTVVKQSDHMFWIDYEEFAPGMDLEQIKQKVKGLGILRDAEGAIRFGN